MHKYIPILLVFSLVFLSQCRKAEHLTGKEKNIFKYSWGTNDQIFIEDNKFHSFKYLDTLNHQLNGDSLVPIIFINKEQLIINQLVPTNLKMVEKGETTDYVITKAQFLPDTFTFALKKYIDKQFLILFSNASASRVYNLKNKAVDLPEIRSDFQPKYKIGGYSVGDVIDRDKIEIIYSDIFGSKVTEEAFLIDNQDIQFTILGYHYIEKIERSNIRDKELSTLIQSIGKFFSKDHEYEEIINGEDNFQEVVKGYYWNEKDVSIFLQKIERSYENQDDNFWTLEYSDYIITTILQNYLEVSPENI